VVILQWQGLAKSESGWNHDVSHIVALADGGDNSLENIVPMPHDQHVEMHKANGDFIRWGGWSGRRR
jgi:hypothetical protein